MLTWNEAALADNYNNAVARWADAYYDLEARFCAVRDELTETAENLERLRNRLIQTNAHALGLNEQVAALKAALRKLDPNHPLFLKNSAGKVWPQGPFKGEVASNVGLEYIREFEDALLRSGVKKADTPLWYVGRK